MMYLDKIVYYGASWKAGKEKPLQNQGFCKGLGKEKWWVEKDSNLRKRMLTDLQSAPFDRSGIYPLEVMCGECIGIPAP